MGDGLEARAGGGRAGGTGDGRGWRRALGYPWARMLSGHRPAVDKANQQVTQLEYKLKTI